MLKVKTILIFVCMLILLVGCVQIYLVLSMGIFRFNNLFLYGILFLAFFYIIVVAHKKNKAFLIAGIFFMFALMSVKLGFKNIYNYYFDKTISEANILKTDLQLYYNNYKKFPERLTELYKKSQIPQYNIGLLKYHFRYYKTDTSYRLYFYHFDGQMFVNYGESNVWNFYD